MTNEFLIRRSDTDIDEDIESCNLYYRNLPSGSPILSYAISPIVSVNNSEFVGWNVPNFHKRKRAGELLPMTPWDQFFENGSATGYIDVVTTDGHTFQRFWSVGKYVPEAKWRLTTDEVLNYLPGQSAQAQLIEAAAKIYSNGHDTLTFLAEFASVKDLFIKTAKKLIKMDFPRNWKALSGNWLATRYGWRTLLYDLSDLNKALRSLDEKRTRYSECAGRTYSDTYEYGEDESWSLGTLTRTWNDKVTVGIRGSVVADITVPKFQFNPLQTGWELIPFSFVIDWFVNVGKAIAAWSFLSLQTDYVAAYGWKVEIERNYSKVIGVTNQNYSSGAVNVSGSSTIKIEKRIPSRIPLLPRFNLKLDMMKIIDLIMLVLQRTR